ncbi:flavin reductase family protein [Rhodococcus sp. NPDC059968]|uniref:flavin reductase family protein n=1 Tax=Rhodococcus sp. NPDC059968 TaxID=3347017 RepID=UPI003673579D
MIVLVSDDNDTVDVSVLQPGDCKRLHVQGTRGQLASELGALLERAELGSVADEDHVWLSVSALRSRAGYGRGPEWADRFAAMLDYARRQGWCSSDGHAVRAHVEGEDREWDNQHFRKVLGHYPTGVTIVTAVDSEGSPAGLAVGSFTSVSLQPPLVAFLPTKTSTSFPKIKTAKSFCVNILAHDQEAICRTFAMSGTDKFASVSWHEAPSGAPIIEGTAGWIDCEFHDIVDAGDHHIVLGLVRDLYADSAREPLAFLHGQYGSIAMPKFALETANYRHQRS